MTFCFLDLSVLGMFIPMDFLLLGTFAAEEVNYSRSNHAE